MSERGMKKWAPYSSLIEQSTCLEKMRYEKNKIEKPKISIDKAEKINRILLNYKKQELTITYFYDGYLYTVKTIVKRIDEVNKQLILPEGKLPLNEIIDIVDENISNDIYEF